MYGQKQFVLILTKAGLFNGRDCSFLVENNFDVGLTCNCSFGQDAMPAVSIGKL